MDNEIAVLDTYMDAHMYQAMERHEPNVLKAALDINSYARYWHGYLIIPRSLAVVFEYDEIRFFLGTMIMLLFAVELLLLRKYNVKDMGYGFLLLFISGMVTNYFDFLTYPIITLGGAAYG